MKGFRTTALILISGVLTAQDVEHPNLPKGSSPEAVAARKEFFMTKTGGFLDVKGTGPAIFIVDMRKEPTWAPQSVATAVAHAYRLPVTNCVAQLGAGSCAMKEAVEIRKREKALIVVAISLEGRDMSALSIFPEERVAIVNVDKLSFDGTSGEELEIRLIKEIWRAIGFAGGIGYASHANSVMRPVSSPIELDANKFQVMQPTEFQQMHPLLQKYGVKQGHRTIYRRACEEGWAPQPTNEYQRAVWERVMAAKSAATNAPATTPPAK